MWKIFFCYLLFNMVSPSKVVDKEVEPFISRNDGKEDGSLNEINNDRREIFLLNQKKERLLFSLKNAVDRYDIKYAQDRDFNNIVQVFASEYVQAFPKDQNAENILKLAFLSERHFITIEMDWDFKEMYKKMRNY